MCSLIDEICSSENDSDRAISGITFVRGERRRRYSISTDLTPVQSQYMFGEVHSGVILFEITYNTTSTWDPPCPESILTISDSLKPSKVDVFLK